MDRDRIEELAEVLRAYTRHGNGTVNSRYKKKTLISTIKMEIGCESKSCGWTSEFVPEMLHLDHIDPSTKDTRLKTGPKRIDLAELSWIDLINEMMKCRVLCANCHHKKSKEEEDWKS